MPQERKRRKIDLAGSPQEWLDHVAEINSQNATLPPTALVSQMKEEVKKDFNNQMEMPQEASVSQALHYPPRKAKTKQKETMQ